MPTLVARSSSGTGASDAGPSISSLVAQAAAVERVRSRFLTAASRSTSSLPPAAATAAVSLDDSLLLEDDDNTDALSSASSAPPPLSPQEMLEAEFAAAVVFVDTYQGPHRILRQENSTPRKDFYALYQQATVGACTLMAPPLSASKLEIARWEKWRALGHLPRHEAMRRYTATLDNLVDDWRRTAGLSRLSAPAAATANLSASVISTTSSGGGGGVAGSPRPVHQRVRVVLFNGGFCLFLC
jgi:acyl-CoA-binding protein